MAFSNSVVRANGINSLKETNFFPFYTKQALADRWNCSRQLINHKVKSHEDFPKPVEGLVKGGGPYYPLYEIMRYEQARGFKVHS